MGFAGDDELKRRGDELRRRLHRALPQQASPPQQGDLIRRSEELRERLKQSALYRPSSQGSGPAEEPRKSSKDDRPTRSSRSGPVHHRHSSGSEEDPREETRHADRASERNGPSGGQEAWRRASKDRSKRESARPPVVLVPARPKRVNQAPASLHSARKSKRTPLTLQQLSAMARAGTVERLAPARAGNRHSVADEEMLAAPVGLPPVGEDDMLASEEEEDDEEGEEESCGSEAGDGVSGQSSVSSRRHSRAANGRHANSGGQKAANRARIGGGRSGFSAAKLAAEVVAGDALAQEIDDAEGSESQHTHDECSEEDTELPRVPLFSGLREEELGHLDADIDGESPQLDLWESIEALTAEGLDFGDSGLSEAGGTDDEMMADFQGDLPTLMAAAAAASASPLQALSPSSPPPTSMAPALTGLSQPISAQSCNGFSSPLFKPVRASSSPQVAGQLGSSGVSSPPGVASPGSLDCASSRGSLEGPSAQHQVQAVSPACSGLARSSSSGSGSPAALAQALPTSPAATTPQAASAPQAVSAKNNSGQTAPGGAPAKRARTEGTETKIMAGWQAVLDRTRKHPHYAMEFTRRFEVEGKTWRKPAPGTKGKLVLGLDCEMVYAKDDPSALARVTVVSYSGQLYNAYVARAKDAVLDYRTSVSGVEAHHLLPENGAQPFAEVQEQVLALISPETILVGHALHNDLKALRIVHTKVVDTALLFKVQGKTDWQKHRLRSVVSLMRSKAATLQNFQHDAPHDSRQDAEWALQLALYEASIFPKSTPPLKLQTFPKKVFITEIPKGTAKTEVQALFRGGVVSDIAYQLVEDLGKWQGRATVTFQSQADRDAAITALARFACVRAGPFRDWSARRDVAKMQTELDHYFSRFGRVAGCRVFRLRAAPGQPAYPPVAQVNCHPATARALLEASELHNMATHRSFFKVKIVEEEATKRRCTVPLSNGHFVAKVQ